MNYAYQLKKLVSYLVTFFLITSSLAVQAELDIGEAAISPSEQAEIIDEYNHIDEKTSNWWLLFPVMLLGIGGGYSYRQYQNNAHLLDQPVENSEKVNGYTYDQAILSQLKLETAFETFENSHDLTFYQQIIRLGKLSNIPEVLSGERKICLIIGRTSDENAPPLPTDKCLWVFGNIIETKRLTENDPIQLTADFNPGNDFQREFYSELRNSIPREVFDMIVFDGSTWKFFASSAPYVFSFLYDLLKDNGELYFDGLSGSYGISVNNDLEQISYHGISYFNKTTYKANGNNHKLAFDRLDHSYSLSIRLINEGEKYKFKKAALQFEAQKHIFDSYVRFLISEKGSGYNFIFSNAHIYNSQEYPYPVTTNWDSEGHYDYILAIK